jgi:hypothetical protein
MIGSVEQFIEAVREGSSDWNRNEPKWFRGEPGEPCCKTPLVPSLYRDREHPCRENELLQLFRTRASGYSDAVPHRDHTDQWLFLAQHVGLPTRLLDWSEGALIGLHFALKKKNPVVWMLNPLELNVLTFGPDKPREFPLPWHDPEQPKDKPECKERLINPAFENIAGAWTNGQNGVDLPIAIYPTHVHPRLRSQRACFTVHGKHKEGLGVLVSDTKILQRFKLDPACCHSMLQDLQLLGITDDVLFPDLDGLAKDLKQRFY